MNNHKEIKEYCDELAGELLHFCAGGHTSYDKLRSLCMDAATAIGGIERLTAELEKIRETNSESFTAHLLRENQYLTAEIDRHRLAERDSITLVETQGKQGNWDNSAYMTGMYNGMELILATFQNREPKFRETCVDAEQALTSWAGDDMERLTYSDGGIYALRACGECQSECGGVHAVGKCMMQAVRKLKAFEDLFTLACATRLARADKKERLIVLPDCLNQEEKDCINGMISTMENAQRCRECGYTYLHGCEVKRFWVEDDLCNECAPPERMKEVIEAFKTALEAAGKE